jgi:hypothetical protein
MPTSNNTKEPAIKLAALIIKHKYRETVVPNGIDSSICLP